MTKQDNKTISFISNLFGLDVNDVLSKSRKRSLSDFRCICIYNLRLKGKTLRSTGDIFNMSHCAVIYNLNKYDNIVSSIISEDYKQLIIDNI